MRAVVVCVVALAFAAPVWGQQTEEQKLLFERARKKIQQPDQEGWTQSVSYLAKRKAGVPIVEDAVIELRKKTAGYQENWRIALAIYAGNVQPEDVPDRMIPEYIAELEFRKKDQSVFFRLPKIVEFGPRAKAAVPTLEWIRDNAAEERAAKAAADAIRKIKGQ